MKSKKSLIFVAFGSVLIIVVGLLMWWFEYKATHPSSPMDPIVP